MAIFIFDKNTNGVSHPLYRMAASQSDFDNNKSLVDEHYDIITVSDDDFNNVKKGIKEVASRTDNTVSYSDCSFLYNDGASLQKHINAVTETLDEWLKDNSSKPMHANVQAYRDYINSLDVNSIITAESPLETSLEAYVESQGQTAFHPLQLL